MTPSAPAGPPDPGASLAPGVLRLAAELPSAGPRGGDLTPVAAWIGAQVGAELVVLRVLDPQDPCEHRWSAPGRPDVPAATTVTSAHPIRHHGVEVATLLVTLPAPHPLDTPHHLDAQRHLDEVAAVLGVVVAGAAAQTGVRAARRWGQDVLAWIADARQRAASRMESERHALERDLHDGAQLHLVSLQLAAAVVEHRLATATADEDTLTAAVTDLGARLDRTHQLLVDTAAGITPVPLQDAGLAPALALSFREAHNVTLDIGSDVRARRYPPSVESTVYFTCLEAVNNAHKHAPGAAVVVAVRNTYQGLWFEVADSGPGLADAASTGLAQLRARLAAVGGTLHVTSAPGEGTRVAGTVPL
ncbi:histidine kinase [Frankia torreyi]|uniref:histidine kinase n=1 Tax=Frankia torreyi TaxID=1856 RepID=A0A0D8B8X8_9ACTN|nr:MULTISPECIES: ATP-binding protein [Frankia]KJE19827.1 histidine kinase [Frankia torreyi]KQM02115.1 histidine kinase [Frankia sp. CpI1-P]